MSRRRAPRPAAEAFRAALGEAAPQTPLARVQARWEATVGPQVAAVAAPVAERDGELTVECADPVWANELDLMQGTLLERLRGNLGEAAPRSLRFRLREPGSP